MSSAAARKNIDILGIFNLDLAKALEAHNNSPLRFGSEFKPVPIIAPIFKDHPLWWFTANILSQGASFPLSDITKDSRNMDIDFMISWGSHEFTLKNKHTVNKLIKEDIIHCFSLILPIKATHQLQGVAISPLGCQDQLTINDWGEFVTKHRLTHDQTFPGLSGTSTNLRVLTDALPPCKYGHCIKRIINYIISNCLQHPAPPQSSCQNLISIMLIEGIT
jgi:hypothetical protein